MLSPKKEKKYPHQNSTSEKEREKRKENRNYMNNLLDIEETIKAVDKS